MIKASPQKRKGKFSATKFGNDHDSDEGNSKARYITIEIKDLDAESKTLHQTATIMDMESFRFTRARPTARGSNESHDLQKLARKEGDPDTASAKRTPNASTRLTILSIEQEKHSSAKTTVTKDSEEPRELSLSEEEGKAPKKTKGNAGSQSWMKKKALKNVHANGKIVVKGRHADGSNEMLVEELASEELSSDQMYLPSFVRPENIRDKMLRVRSDPDYDPTTLYIPDSEWSKMKLLMQQYWKVKSNYFDKLVAIRIGRLYWFYFQDAVIVHRVLDSRLNLFKNMTSTFVNEHTIFRYIHKIFEQNLAVVLIEQMEESRSEDAQVMNRALNRVLTKGTYTEHENASYHPQYLMSLYQEDEVIGVTLVETTTHEIQIGDFVEDDRLLTLKSLLNRARPSEIVYMRSAVSPEVLKAIKGLSWKPVVSASRNDKTKSVDEIYGAISQCFKAQKVTLPDFLSEIFDLHQKSKRLKGKGDFEKRKESSLSFYHSLQAFQIAAGYLEYLLLADTVIPFAEYKPLEIDPEKPDYLRLDGQALDNLEIFEVDFFLQSTEQNSLFNFMDNTSSPYGKRLFRNWLMYPLADPQQIKERLLAVDDLRQIQPQVSEFQAQLAKLPDIERTIHKFYSLLSKRRYEAVFHENLPLNKLNEFLKLLTDLKKIEPLIGIFAEEKSSFKSTKLKRLVTVNLIEKKSVGKSGRESIPSAAGLFPRVSKHIEELENKIDYYDGLPVPAAGVDEDCDRFVSRINDMKGQLDEQLTMYRTEYETQKICYVHTKHRYEMEFPDSIINEANRPDGFVITSKRKGFNRYHTPLTEKLLKELEEAERGFQDLLVPFLLKYFKNFYEKHQVWKQMIACLAELDCLCSLAVLSVKMKGSSKPKILDQEKSVLKIKELTHPCVAKLVKHFTPNDLVFDKDTKVLLITGPNMGGKSTLLRQTCIAIIMAQVGSWVPCESIELTPFDKIFTRIGASDRIMEGKSTFYLELEETLAIVKEATSRSFVIMDELGRGTATYDGIALASAVLKYMIEKIGCFLLFTTHYRMLLNGFEGVRALKPCYMDYKSDEKKEEIKFLYKLKEGVAPSFGINVARIAGLPKEVIQQAKEKSMLMESSKVETTSNQTNLKFLTSLTWLNKLMLE